MRAAVALIALALTGCTTAPVTKVGEILAHCDAYKGKIVRAAGYLGECGGYSCQLFPDRSGMQAFESLWNEQERLGREANGNPDRKAQAAVWDRLQAIWPMSVGFNAGVEPRMATLSHSHVVITGRMNSESCVGQGTDRSEGIHPTDIRVWTPEEGAPGGNQ